MRESPFLKVGEPLWSNISLLALLTPILISAPFMRAPYTGSAWGWLSALVGSFLGVLIFAPDKRASLARLDWAAGAVLAGLLSAFPANAGLEIATAAGMGLICGVLSVRPSSAKLLGCPGLAPVIALGATLLTVGLVSRLTLIQPRPLYFRWGPVYWPHLFALAAAGFCFATQRRSLVYWGLPWAAAAISFFLIPTPPVRSGILDSPEVFFFGRLAVFMAPVFFIAPQLARSKLELGVYEILTLLFLFFPAPKNGWLYQGLDTAVFWLVLSFWPVHKFFRRKTVAAVKSPAPSPSAAKAFIRCGHGGGGQRLSIWQGLPNCRLASFHNGGPLMCPYGCLGFGDCMRVCRFKAISLNGQSFPVIDSAACQGCGRCAEVCPKGLIELIEGPMRAFIPCRSQSGLKKNAAYCEKSCLGCSRCRKACPAGAISRDGSSGAMKIDQAICRAYGASCERICAQICPRKIIGETRL